MPKKIIILSFLILTSFALYTTTLSDELLMLENLEAQEIAEASANPQSRSLEKLDDTKLYAVLGVVTSFLFIETNEKSKFDQVIVEASGSLNRYLSGKVTDKEEVEELVVSTDDSAPDEVYLGGIIIGKSFHDKGTTVVLTVTDLKGDVTTETRVM